MSVSMHLLCRFGGGHLLFSGSKVASVKTMDEWDISHQQKIENNLSPMKDCFSNFVENQ